MFKKMNKTVIFFTVLLYKFNVPRTGILYTFRLFQKVVDGFFGFTKEKIKVDDVKNVDLVKVGMFSRFKTLFST